MTEPTDGETTAPWVELRSAVLVGTERRPPPVIGAAPPGAAETDPARQALQAAALLGVGRRAGLVPMTGQDSPGPSTDGSAEGFAPDQADQLLSLLLAGSLGKPTVTDPLVEHWSATCAAAGLVVGHERLSTLLARATSSTDLRPSVRPVLGSRGAWLAARRRAWSWAVEPTIVDETGPLPADDVEGYLALGSDARRAALAALRDRDPEAGRRMVSAGWSGADAATRTDLITALGTNLGPADEEFVEAALDDRAKGVRGAAIGLLEQLPGSARATRLADRLDGLLAKTPTRFRSTLIVDYPPAPVDAERRDLPPDGSRRLTAEGEWLRVLVAGAPLGWWERRLGRTPAQILGSGFEPASDLLPAWTRAAVAQRNEAWAHALFRLAPQPALLPLVGAAMTDGDLVAMLDGGKNHQHVSRLLEALPGPWSATLSEAVIDWVRRQDAPAPALGNIQSVLARQLDGAVLPVLESWLERLDADTDRILRGQVRTTIRHLSTRLSITEAFR